MSAPTDTQTDIVQPTRRDFFRLSALGLAAGAAVAACGGPGNAESAAAPAAAPAAGGMPHPDTNHTGGTIGAHPRTPQEVRAAADAMDAHHEAGIKSFPARTQGKGNQLMEPRMENGVKVFELTAAAQKWETEPGKFVDALAYNGQVPGPQIRVTEGDRVRIVVKNNLEQSTAVHFHGVEVPNDQDGVPFITQPPIKPGETYTYEFTVPQPGLAHVPLAPQRGRAGGQGAAGRVHRRAAGSQRAIENVDVDYVMILNDGSHGYTLNGKGFPATEPIVAKLGQKLRIRFMNEGMMIHPMHLHGMHMTVIDKDGWPQPRRGSATRSTSRRASGGT